MSGYVTRHIAMDITRDNLVKVKNDRIIFLIKICQRKNFFDSKLHNFPQIGFELIDNLRNDHRNNYSTDRRKSRTTLREESGEMRGKKARVFESSK